MQRLSNSLHRDESDLELVSDLRIRQAVIGPEQKARSHPFQSRDPLPSHQLSERLPLSRRQVQVARTARIDTRLLGAVW